MMDEPWYIKDWGLLRAQLKGQNRSSFCLSFQYSVFGLGAELQEGENE